MKKNWKLPLTYEGPGGIREVFLLAFPIIVSQGTESLMMFTDRLFLSHYDATLASAALSGGATFFMVTTFFVGLLSYGTTVVAQHFGARKFDECPRAIFQSFILVVLSYPILLLGNYVAPLFFEWTGHTQEQIAKEFLYYRYLSYFSWLLLARIAISSFFSGIGRTGVIMKAHLLGLVTNIPFTYALIYGVGPFPTLGLKGAAIGTVLGTTATTLYLILSFFSPTLTKQFQTLKNLKFDPHLMKTLIRFGGPNGVEFLLTFGAFNIFINLFKSYGVVESLAITTTINWEILAFLPIVGLHIAIMSLVGKYMGARKIAYAVQSTFTGLGLGLSFILFCSTFFFLVPEVLIDWFLPDQLPVSAEAVFEQSKFMLRVVAFYLLGDATQLVFFGALRGAGDTIWPMRVSIVLHWIMLFASYLQIRVYRIDPAYPWLTLMSLVFLLAITGIYRFRQGHWKNIEMVKPSKPSNSPSASPPTSGQEIR